MHPLDPYRAANLLIQEHGHALAATVAAGVVLAARERQGLVVMQKPSLPMPGVAPKG